MLIESLNTLTKKQETRNYLGCSSIGHPCERYLWRNYHEPHSFEISYTRARIFGRGMIEESRLLNDIDKLRNTCVQRTQVEVRRGSLKGHIDAIIALDGVQYILEIKTMAQIYFLKLLREGVAKSNPEYYAQCQTYMGMTNISRAILLVANKNTEELHEELLDFNIEHFEALLEKAKRIETGQKEPIGLAGAAKPMWKCNSCCYLKHCWGA